MDFVTLVTEELEEDSSLPEPLKHLVLERAKTMIVESSFSTTANDDSEVHRDRPNSPEHQT